MAADDVLLDIAAQEESIILRFYAWDRPSVSIGYFQSCTIVPEHFSFVRRPTGGGLVFHDQDITYTLAVPKSHPFHNADRDDSYRIINDAVIDSLSRLQIDADLTQSDIPDGVDRKTMVCFTTPTRYDVIHGDHKVAGAAQRRSRHALLHQGSIDCRHLPGLPREQYCTKLREALEQKLNCTFVEFTPIQFSLDSRIKDRVNERYGQDEWNLSRS